MTTGERIKSRRKALGMSAERLAPLCNVSAATIYRYENGDIESIGTDKLARVAVALSTTPAYLMGWTDDPMIPDKNETPSPVTEGQRSEIQLIFDQLDSATQTKLLELAHLYLDGQNKNEETK